MNALGKKIFFISIFLFGILLLYLKVDEWYTHRYSSPEKLTEVFQKCETEFETAKEVLARLPEHPEGDEESYYGITLIRDKDHWNPSDSEIIECNLVNRAYENIWISSYIPYTDQEYKQIYEAVIPLLRKQSIEKISVMPKRKQIAFSVYIDPASWGGHFDVVRFDAMMETLEGEALNEYIDSFVMPRRPIDYAIIKAGWIAYSQKR